MKNRHPKGLIVLFFTEMWERFSFYGMRAILVLYLTQETIGENPGLGWTKADALSLYAWYMGLVYGMSIPGGILADRLLGQKKTVLVGGVLIAAGQLTLAVPGIETFYAGLALIISGVGCLKPNISTMVGGLYREGDSRRDSGFVIFYIGINIGAFAAPLAVGAVGELYGWRYAFGMAGIGMLLGLAVYLWGQKHLKDVGLRTSPKAAEVDKKTPLTPVERDRVIVLLISFLIVVVFWAAYEQAGGLMNLYTKEKINRVIFDWKIPTSWFQSVPAAFVIILGGVVAAFWARRSKKGKENSSLFKMALGIMITGSGFLFMSGAAMQAETGVKAMLIFLVMAYLLHVVGELCLSPVALSFITKLAPAKYAASMMGLYFAATGLGGLAAGKVGELATRAGEFEVFTGIFVFCAVFGLLLLVFFKKLKALTHGAEEIKS